MDKQPAPKCALCTSPATRVMPIFVDIRVEKASPIHLAGAQPGGATIDLHVALCDECNVVAFRTRAAEPTPIVAPKLVRPATAGELGKLAVVSR